MGLITRSLQMGSLRIKLLLFWRYEQNVVSMETGRSLLLSLGCHFERSNEENRKINRSVRKDKNGLINLDAE